MATRLTQRQKRTLEQGGALLVEIPLQTQPKGTYYNEYGEALHGLPRDAWSLVHYLSKGFRLEKPAKPKKRAEGGIGVEDWDGKTKGGTADQSQTGPTATYYTAAGTSVHNLPADPASMAAYLASGMTLDPPTTDVPPPITKAPSRRRKTATA